MHPSPNILFAGMGIDLLSLAKSMPTEQSGWFVRNADSTRMSYALAAVIVYTPVIRQCAMNALQGSTINDNTHKLCTHMHDLLVIQWMVSMVDPY